VKMRTSSKERRDDRGEDQDLSKGASIPEKVSARRLLDSVKSYYPQGANTGGG